MKIAPPIQVKKVYQLPIHEVWEIITSQTYLSQWLMTGNFRPVKGYDYIFNCEPNDDCSDGQVFGKVLDVKAPYSITFTWNSKGISKETTVRFQLEELTEGVCFSILHEGFPVTDAQAIEAHTTGWNFHLSEITKIEHFEKS